MKKLMVVAAAMVLGSSVFGAAVTWNAKQGAYQLSAASTFVDNDHPGTAIGGTMYIFVATAYTQETLVNAVLGGSSVATLADTYGVKAANGTSTFSTTVGANGLFTDTTFMAEVNGASQVFYNVIVTEGGDFYVGNTQTVAWNDKTFGNFSENWSGSGRTNMDHTSLTAYATTNPKNGWYGAVPEPTSGLLLLLGVAGLALKRRRA